MKRTLALAGSAILAAGIVFTFQSAPNENQPRTVSSESNYPASTAASATTPTASAPQAGPAEASAPPGPSAIPAFSDWLSRWQAADETERAALREEGRRLAQARRPVMQRLIQESPEMALSLAVRQVVRQDLPAEVVEQLEKPVSARGDFKAYFGRPQEGAVLPPDQPLAVGSPGTELEFAL